jgi:hypothetical protein
VGTPATAQCPPSMPYSNPLERPLNLHTPLQTVPRIPLTLLLAPLYARKTARRLELHCTAKPALRRAWSTVSRHMSLPPATLVSGGCVPTLARSSKSSSVLAGEPRRVPCRAPSAALLGAPSRHITSGECPQLTLPRPSHPCVEESTSAFSTARGSPAQASSVGEHSSASRLPRCTVLRPSAMHIKRCHVGLATFAMPREPHPHGFRAACLENCWSPTTGIWLFAECFISGTRQRSSLPSAMQKTLGKRKHSAKKLFVECFIFDTRQRALCRVSQIQHSTKSSLLSVFFSNTRQRQFKNHILK